MRSIINISLPEESAREIAKEVKAGGFASTSEFFRHLYREYKSIRLARELEQSRRDYRAGKWKRLDSVNDLWQR